MTARKFAKRKVVGEVRPAPDAYSWHCACGIRGIEFDRPAAELALYMHRRHDPKHRVSSP